MDKRVLSVENLKSSRFVFEISHRSCSKTAMLGTQDGVIRAAFLCGYTAGAKPRLGSKTLHIRVEVLGLG